MADQRDIEFESEVERLLASRDGTAAVRKLVHEDPLARYAAMFNDRMTGVDGESIDRAYRIPQAALARRIDAGLVPHFPALLRLASAVLSRTALKYCTLAYRRANPRVPRRDAAGRAAAGGRPSPLFVAVPDLTRYAAPWPAEAGDAGPPKRLAFAEARGLGRRHLQAYRRVLQYQAERGTRHGAFRAAARLAVLDGGKKVVSLRPFHRLGACPAPPPPAVVRQVRRLFGEARAAIRRRAASLGYEVGRVV